MYPNPNYALAATLLAQLQHCGCRRVVISPGSRSTPLAHTALELSGFQTYVLTDERSAAYFALGLSRAERTPAILICTSGTAAANYFPAVIEAAQGMVPLLMLTADRPPTLRHRGAPQTIDQVELYGRYPRFFGETPSATEANMVERVRALALRAYLAAVAQPGGPAHLNVPFDEPLAPVASSAANAAFAAATPLDPAVRPPPRFELRAATLQIVRDSQCGLIVAGPGAAGDERAAHALHFQARQLGWPIFADVLSGLRFAGDPVIPCYDILLRNAELSTLSPDVVLAFGAHPTSKVLNQWLDAQREAYTLRVQPHGLVQDPTHRATETIVAECEEFCAALTAGVTAARDSWLLEPFQRGTGALNSLLSAWNPDDDAAAELAYVFAALRSLAPDTRVILANSMSIRYADAIAGQSGTRLQAYGLRGANGIDGTLSHAAGIAAAATTAAVLFTGDLAFLHDLTGLMAARRFAGNLSVVLFNNDGGGIFHFLPVHETGRHFETLHGTPHGLHLRAAAGLFDLDWEFAASPSELAARLQTPARRARVLEVRTNRDANYAAQQRLMARFAAAAAT
ncbi:2-succinyl-5-enolpyruvyl-6-hydroxy-3-cyclohexene-1-carboxylic-acid synthase [candidate division KSB1 bacterium]|nr:2-succinyl-5-enolpyruvyl-6-hydroxy-3-cyclohexene-1-carboxylic-acid synthase [candidate division KSB1 bacterium]